MIDSVRVAYAAIRGRGVPADLDIVRSDVDDRVFLGIDHALRPHLLVIGQEEGVLPNISTLAIQRRPLGIGTEIHDTLDIACLFETLAEVFDHFAAAVIARLGSDANPSRAVADTLESWQRFMVPSAGPPGRDRLAAVFGELTMLCDVVASDPARRVDVWAGPRSARHDLRRGLIAIEVKTTRAHTRREVTVHGEDQLEPPEGGELYLHFVRLEEAPGHGEAVNDLVERLLALGVSTDELFAVLDDAGIPPADLPAIAEVRFDMRERLTIPVDDDTPRIVPSTFVAGERPAGITDLTYRIDLDHVVDRALDQAQLDALVARLAQG